MAEREEVDEVAVVEMASRVTTVSIAASVVASLATSVTTTVATTVATTAATTKPAAPRPPTLSTSAREHQKALEHITRAVADFNNKFGQVTLEGDGVVGTLTSRLLLVNESNIPERNNDGALPKKTAHTNTLTAIMPPGSGGTLKQLKRAASSQSP